MNRTKQDYLLSCISEEAGEITQAVSKAVRFGLYDINPQTNNTAWLQIRQEVHDLIAAYEDFCDVFGKSSVLDRDLILKKKLKAMKMVEYSQNINHLEIKDEQN